MQFHEHKGAVPFELTLRARTAPTKGFMQRPLPNWRGGRLAEKLAAMPADGAAATVTRGLGFILLAGLGLLIIAGVVLLPAMARYSQAQHEQACLEAKNASDAALIVAYQRLAADIPNDPVLAKRLAMREFGFLPQGEIVLPASMTPLASHTQLVTVERQPPPPAPNAWLLNTAGKVSGPVTRTLLLLLAIALLAAAITLTTPWADKRREPAICDQ